MGVARRNRIIGKVEILIIPERKYGQFMVRLDQDSITATRLA